MQVQQLYLVLNQQVALFSLPQRRAQRVNRLSRLLLMLALASLLKMKSCMTDLVLFPGEPMFRKQETMEVPKIIFSMILKTSLQELLKQCGATEEPVM